MAKATPKVVPPVPIIIKSGQKFSGHGYKGSKIKPFIPPVPQKNFDPNKIGTISVK